MADVFFGSGYSLYRRGEWLSGVHGEAGVCLKIEPDCLDLGLGAQFLETHSRNVFAGIGEISLLSDFRIAGAYARMGYTSFRVSSHLGLGAQLRLGVAEADSIVDTADLYYNRFTVRNDSNTAISLEAGLRALVIPGKNLGLSLETGFGTYPGTEFYPRNFGGSLKFALEARF